MTTPYHTKYFAYDLTRQVQPGGVDRLSMALFDACVDLNPHQIEASGQEWNAETKRKDPWRGIYPYSKAEHRDKNGALVADSDAKASNATIRVWSEISAAAPASKQSPTTRDPNHPNYRFYNPLHPVTGNPCQHPRSGWKFPYNPDPDNPDRRCFLALQLDNRIAWGEDEKKLPRTKGFLHEVETNIGTSVFEYNDGESELTDLFGESGLFLSPKSSRFVRKFITQTTRGDDCFIDFFGGSGSSGHAVITQNREDGGKRRQVLVEVADHFNSILLPRLKKVVYSQSWKNGRPVVRSGGNHTLKYVRLESYEDALNNLKLTHTQQQATLLDEDNELREQYLLSYMLDVESRGSQPLLNVDSFRNPD